MENPKVILSFGILNSDGIHDFEATVRALDFHRKSLNDYIILNSTIESDFAKIVYESTNTYPTIFIEYRCISFYMSDDSVAV